jgi:hypothetical protein
VDPAFVTGRLHRGRERGVRSIEERGVERHRGFVRQSASPDDELARAVGTGGFSGVRCLEIAQREVAIPGAVVGTGGENHMTFHATPTANSEVRDNTSFGFLELTLSNGAYAWRFQPDPPGGFSDSGTGTCH